MGWEDKLADKVSISHKEWQEAAKNQKRVSVIESVWYLDFVLKNLLELIFVQWNNEVKKQFNPNNGSLAYLTQKARLVYSLGYINKSTLNDLQQINKIRNRFAHNVDITFTDAEVCKYVNNLSVAKNYKITLYRIYMHAVDKCFKNIKAGIKQEAFRKAVLKKAVKEKSQQKTKKE